MNRGVSHIIVNLKKNLFSCDLLCFINTSESFLLILTVGSISDAMRDNVLPQKVVTRTSTKLIYIQFLFFLVAISAGYHILLYVLFQFGSKMVDIRYFGGVILAKNCHSQKRCNCQMCITYNFLFSYIAYIARMQCHQYINFIQSITCK